MTTTPHAAAAGAARQRLASVLGTLQQDPNVPPAVLDVVSGLAAAMGPLFQLERGNPDAQLFVQARTVLQQTLEKMQLADQNYPGVSDATGAIAQSLGIIFQAMREAGLVPAAGSSASQPAAAPPAAQPAVAQPAVQPAVAPAQPVMPPVSQQPQPVAQPFSAPQPVAAAPVASVHRAPTPAPVAQPPVAPRPMASAGGAPPQVAANVPRSGASGTGQHRALGGAPQAPQASVPVGPNGLPRLESEIGVHSETNFYTDFLGDIRSNGGIFVATFHVLPIGAPCEVLLTFPGNLTAEFRGQVKWRRDAGGPGESVASSPGLGIAITQAGPEAWDLIERFMRKREPIMHEM